MNKNNIFTRRPLRWISVLLTLLGSGLFAASLDAVWSDIGLICLFAGQLTNIAELALGLNQEMSRRVDAIDTNSAKRFLAFSRLRHTAETAIAISIRKCEKRLDALEKAAKET